MGDTSNNRGMSKTHLYRVWIDMKSRCFTKSCGNYRHYGARGITICDEWLGKDGFCNFKAWSLSHGYARTLSIDRIDNNGNYEPDNCRWVTKNIQNINKRPTNPNTSGFVGIRKHTSGTGWYGSVKIDNVDHYTGFSKDITEAVRMRNEYILSNGLPNALNEVV